MFMQRWFNRIVILTLAAALLAARSAQAQLASSLPRGDAKEAGFASETLAAIDALLKKAVDERQIAGGAALVACRGRIVHLTTVGFQDAEAGTPISEATIYRIASMTKPITSVAALILVEEGKLRLDDPVSKFIPEFAALRVLVKDAQPDQPLAQITTAAQTPITIRHLLTHTSGITYGLFDRPILGKLLREAGVSDGLIETPGTTADNARRLAGVPLLFQPGTAWEYGLNTDVLGRVIEVAAGQTLDEFFQARIFRPLQMADTHFIVPAEKRSRLAALYVPDESKKIRRVGELPQEIAVPGFALRYSATYPTADKSQYHSGGAGLCSTIGDYARFLQMLANRGELDGQRLLKAETVVEMIKNQIGDFAPFTGNHGDKFGFGLGIVTAAGRGENEVASVGAFSWGGAFYTYFLVDPDQELIAIFTTQIFPFNHLTLHGEFKGAVYAALGK